jgi:hypothetical protein
LPVLSAAATAAIVMWIAFWARPAAAQESAPATAPSLEREEREAEEILREVDARIYRARDQGLRDLRFRWRAKGEGALSDIDFYIHYAWKAPNLRRCDAMTADGKPLDTVPEAYKERPAEFSAFLQQRSRDTEALVETYLLGLRLADNYRDYYKSVGRRDVNNKIETRIEMVPRSKKLFSKIVLKLRDGLPYEMVKTSDAGQVINVYFTFKKEGELYLYRTMRVEVEHRLKDEQTFNYVTIDGIKVLSTIEQRTTMDLKKEVTIKLEDIEVNRNLPNEHFSK